MSGEIEFHHVGPLHQPHGQAETAPQENDDRTIEGEKAATCTTGCRKRGSVLSSASLSIPRRKKKSRLFCDLCRLSLPSGLLPSASLIRCSSISRIGASAGSSASSVFQRCARPACRRRRRTRRRDRTAPAHCGAGPSRAAPARRRPRARAARRARAGGHGPRPSRRAAGIDRAQRVGLGVGVGRVAFSPSTFQALARRSQPARSCGFSFSLAASPSTMPRIACWRCSGVIVAIASCCSRDGWGMPGGGGGDPGSMLAALATRAISARSMGRNGASGGRPRARASARGQRGCRRSAPRAGRDSRARADRRVGRPAPC